MRIHEGERFRLGWGFAWRNYDSNTAEAFIVPLNFVLRWTRDLYFWLARATENERDKAYKAGYNACRTYYQEAREKDNAEWSRTVGFVNFETPNKVEKSSS